METVRSTSELKSAISRGVKVFKVSDGKLKKALLVAMWIREHKVMGMGILAAITGAAVAIPMTGGTSVAAVSAAHAALICTTTGVTISTTELVVLSGLIVSLYAIYKGRDIIITYDKGRDWFEVKTSGVR